MVVVSKFRPLESLQEAYDAGERIFAESRPLEFETKVKSLPEDIEWHFIGHLQTNKLRHVLPHVSLLQSLDSLHLADEIEKFCFKSSKTIDALLEIHVAREDTKHGIAPSEARDAVKYITENCPHIRLRGIMGMATNTDDETVVNADFAALKFLKDRLQEEFPALEELSMGMSSDYPIAIKNGTSIVRIGSAVFE